MLVVTLPPSISLSHSAFLRQQYFSRSSSSRHRFTRVRGEIPRLQPERKARARLRNDNDVNEKGGERGGQSGGIRPARGNTCPAKGKAGVLSNRHAIYRVRSNLRRRLALQNSRLLLSSSARARARAHFSERFSPRDDSKEPQAGHFGAGLCMIIR